MGCPRAIAALLLSLATACAATDARPGAAPVVAGARQPLVVRDVDGLSHDLDRALAGGRPVALVFWQTWCESCRREAPEVVAAARSLGERIEFYGVVPGTDERVDEREVRRVARELGFTFPQLRDRDLLLTERFGVDGTPTILVLVRDGEPVYRGHRPPRDWGAFLAR